MVIGKWKLSVKLAIATSTQTHEIIATPNLSPSPLGSPDVIGYISFDPYLATYPLYGRIKLIKEELIKDERGR
jgi:hypothetical protein